MKMSYHTQSSSLYYSGGVRKALKCFKRRNGSKKRALITALDLAGTQSIKTRKFFLCVCTRNMNKRRARKREMNNGASAS